MNLVYLKAENFLSFAELYHEFIPGAVLVQGKNLTEVESKETNGAGKSSMGAAIAKCILDNALRKQVLDVDLIKWGEEEAHLWLAIHCPVRKETLEIHRTLRTKGGASLELTINDEKVATATLKDGNTFILNWIGITSEDLRNYYLINKENFKSFVSSSNTDKLSLIGRFIKADALDDTDTIIKAKNAPLNEVLSQTEAEYNVIQGEIQAYTTQLESEKLRDLTLERNQQMEGYTDRAEAVVLEAEGYQKDIEAYEAVIHENENKIQAINVKVKEANAQVKELEAKDFSKQYKKVEESRATLDAQIKTAREDYKEVQDLSAEAEAEFRRLETFLKGAVSCPNCGHEFVPHRETELTVAEARAKATDERKTIATAELAIEETKEELDKLLVSVRKFDDEIAKIRVAEQNNIRATRDVQKQISELRGDVQRAESSIKLSRQTITTLEGKINKCMEEAEYLQNKMDELEATPLTNPRLEELEGLIALSNVKLKKREETIDELRGKIASNTQWGLRLKEFKMSLAVEQLKIIQNFANRSLQQQRSELRLAIEGFKTDSKGKVKSEITVYVINGEGEYKSFWSFSGGERARIEIALIIAMAEMINSTNAYGGLHFLQIDEVLEGTDPLGLSLLVESLSEFEYPIYIISHVMNIRAGVTTLTVVKENGQSYIE